MPGRLLWGYCMCQDDQEAEEEGVCKVCGQRIGCFKVCSFYVHSENKLKKSIMTIYM